MSRRTRSLTLASVIIAVALALLVGVNVLASRSTQAWDLTRAGNNTLAPQSVLAAKHLTSDLQVIGLFRAGTDSGQRDTEALIALYAAQSTHVKYRSANADQDAVDVKRYGITQVNTVVLDYGGKTELLLQGSQTEQDFTSALLKLESNRVPMVCWAVGDGERSLTDANQKTGYSAVATLLEKNNFAHKEVLLGQLTSIPSDCDELAIIDPTAEIPASAVKAVGTYLAGRGRLLIAAEPWPQQPKTTTSLSAILQPYGLAFSGALVFETDPSRAAVQDPTNPAVLAYGKSPITNDIQGIVSFFPQSTAITGTPAAGVKAVRIAATTSGAYAIATQRSNLARQAGDAAGPFTLMETLESGSGSTATRIVMVGTAAFAQTGTLPPNNNDANLELALGSFQWLAGQDSLIALPPKPERALPLSLTQQDQSVIIFITAFLMPGLIVFGGVMVWWRRRVF
jgi:ABC-type uncharacterized transport system involved in gliding motility auxiliary subunit